MEEKEVLDALASIQSEAVKRAVDAFTEGYMLGRKYGEQFYKKKS